MTEAFSLFTSIRYDPKLKACRARGMKHAGWNYVHDSPLYMLDLHRDRLLRAATHFQWRAAIDALSGEVGLEKLAKQIEAFVGSEQTGPLRLRIVLNRNGNFSFEKFATPPASLENLLPDALREPDPDQHPSSKESLYEVLVDDDFTSRSEFTHYKTTNRGMYDAARIRASLSPPDRKEVLIINRDNGAIMEGSVTSPFFWRDGRWVTPPVPSAFSLEEGSGGNDGTTRRWALERGLAHELPVHVESLVDGEQCWLSNGVRGFLLGRVNLRHSEPALS